MKRTKYAKIDRNDWASIADWVWYGMTDHDCTVDQFEVVMEVIKSHLQIKPRKEQGKYK